MQTLFHSIAENYKDDLHSYFPFPAASDRTAYEALDSALKKEFIHTGEEYLNYRYPPLYAADFMSFSRTGNRVLFENVYFSKRHALNSLVLAECAEHQGRFMDDIINGIFSLCEESAWQLPAHNSYIRDTPQLLLPDVQRPILDLFACETAEILSMICYLLQTELDEVSPFIVKRIYKELDTRIVQPYLKEYFWWMGNGAESTNNWTVWCTQNILLTVFLLDFSKDIKEAVFKKAALSCDYFLADYGDDGCCDEGASYYRHAGLCLFHALDILNSVSNHAFADLFGHQKIKNIAAYIVNVHVDNQYYFNFADCSPVAGRAGVREYLFGKAADLPSLCLFAAKDFKADEDRLYLKDKNHINLYFQLLTVFSYREIMAQDTSPSIAYSDIFYQSTGLFITRNTSLALAVKAGDNDDSHNHNDTGSFTVYKNGLPLLIDIGVESYTKKTFSPKRYEIWTMQSGFHNLPVIEGLDQKAGAEYKASKTEVFLPDKDGSGDSPCISMNLETAYPLKAPLFYRRKIEFLKKENRIILTDETDAKDVILNFITYEKPAAAGNLLSIGTLAAASFEGAWLLTIETLPITDPRLQTAWKHDLYRIRLKLSEPLFTLRIE